MRQFNPILSITENKHTVKDAYSLTRIDETFDPLACTRWFSTLDLVSGYWQVEMHPEDQNKTAFLTKRGLFECNVLEFGLCNDPSSFQRLMDLMFL